MRDGDDRLEGARSAADLMSMTPEPPSPPYADSVPTPDTPERRDRRLAVGLVVVTLVGLVAAVLWFTRSPGPPTVPVALQAVADTCDDPCETLDPRVTLEWAPPESGAEPTGFRLLRDGATLDAQLSGIDLTFVDDSVTMGERFAYQVVALSEEGDSPPTEPVDATVPTPPDDAAHLDGVYDVSLIVRSARSIGAAFGIEDPLPGKRGTDRWSFASTCGAEEGACPSTWTGLDGDITPRGSRWKGRVEGLPARCGRDGRAAAPSDLSIRSVDVAVVDDTWVVTGFRGSATVSFRCPGFPAASATVEVTGTR
jgi:hypothetical protein